MAEVYMTREQLAEANELINRTRELLDEMRVSFGDQLRYVAVRDELKQKWDRLDAILPPTERL
jgi:hypothetical protein